MIVKETARSLPGDIASLFVKGTARSLPGELLGHCQVNC